MTSCVGLYTLAERARRAERARASVRDEPIDLTAEGGARYRVGLSAGVFVGTATSPSDTETFLRQADAALYEAKDAGGCVRRRKAA